MTESFEFLTSTRHDIGYLGIQLSKVSEWDWFEAFECKSELDTLIIELILHC